MIYEKSRKLGKKMLIFGVNSRSRVNVKPKSNDENERENLDPAIEERRRRKLEGFPQEMDFFL